jgi:hydrogenase/urease accessory protein HupE
VIRVATILVALLIAPVFPGAAHELRPGFLEIRQQGTEKYTVRFKVPARGDLRLRLHARLPADCVNIEAPRTERAGDGFLDRFVVSCPRGLDGREVSIDGLAGTFTDVVVRVVRADGTVQAARLTPDLPYFTIVRTPTWLNIAWTYFALGLQHILLGIDHLLFVLALLLLIREHWMLVKTITAFTLAHSITLAAAALGWAEAPQAPVETVVALSIVFAAAEVPRTRRYAAAPASRSPWIMAFAFGLLHGFGFGGALKEIGLPQSDVPLALLAFNLGVEAGQLLFVAAVLALVASLNRLLALTLPRLRDITAYVIGSLSATWFVQRLAGLVGVA